MYLDALDDLGQIIGGGLVVGQLLEHQHALANAHDLGAGGVHHGVDLVLTRLGIHRKLGAQGGQVVAVLVHVADDTVPVETVLTALFLDGVLDAVEVLVLVDVHDDGHHAEGHGQHHRQDEQNRDGLLLGAQGGLFLGGRRGGGLAPAGVQHGIGGHTPQKRLIQHRLGGDADAVGGVGVSVGADVPAPEDIALAGGLGHGAHAVTHHGGDAGESHGALARVEYQLNFLHG